MAEFPPAGTKPEEFFQTWLPKAFAEAELPPGSEEVSVKLGVKLEGQEGGEWIFHLDRGSMSVSAEPRDEAAFTIVQTVEDWRGALWENRAGAFGAGARSMFQPGQQAASGAGGMTGSQMSPAALEQMRQLDGLIQMVVTGGEGGDWAVGFKLGPGSIPAEPTTSITITADDAAAMEKGELDPMQAFMSGRIQVAGDMALMMQMQAIQMQAAMNTQSSGGGSGQGGATG